MTSLVAVTSRTVTSQGWDCYIYSIQFNIGASFWLLANSFSLSRGGRPKGSPLILEDGLVIILAVVYRGTILVLGKWFFSKQSLSFTVY